MNMQEKMKEKIASAVAAACRAAMEAGELPVPETVPDLESLIRLEVPKDKQHGDFACNAAMVLAKNLRTAPRKIADAIAARIEPDGDILKVEVAGAGFINFYLTSNWLYESLRAVEEQGGRFGRIELGKGKKVMVEFVSANPTGPMHMGNARGGALGDFLASVL